MSCLESWKLRHREGQLVAKDHRVSPLTQNSLTGKHILAWPHWAGVADRDPKLMAPGIKPVCPVHPALQVLFLQWQKTRCTCQFYAQLG